MLDRAADALLGAKTAAEVLEARDMARAVYDAVKTTARLSKGQAGARRASLRCIPSTRRCSDD
jgi:hypothetical protein